MGITLGTGSAVAAWADQSGAGNDVSQTLVARRPTLLTSVSSLGGNPGISFDADQVLFTPSSVTMGRDLTVFAVLGPHTVRGTVIEHRTGSTLGWYVFADGFNATSVLANTIWSRQSPPTTWAVPNSVIVARYRHNISMPENWTNGLPDAITVGGSHPVSGTTTAQLSIGAREDLTTQHRGVIAELAVWNRALEDWEIALLNRYGNSRYRL